MNRKFSPYASLIGAALAFSGVYAANAAERYQGLAFAAGSQTLMYRETHWLYREDGTEARMVLYRCPGGEPFARKRIVYRPNAVAPDFDFADARDGYREGVRSTGGGRQVYWRASRKTAEKQQKITMAPDAVIDAGFDAMVASRWDELVDEGRISARFLLPSRQDFLPVVIRRIAQDEDRENLRLRMSLDAWYGFAVPDTELTYRIRDRRLIRFEGIGTIRGAKGRHQAVRIEFPDSLRAARVDDGEVEAAKALALTGRCQG